MKSLVLFVAQHEGAESAKNIRATLAKTLRARFNLDLDIFFDRFSFTTDCAAVMPRVFDASVSANQIPFSDRWIGCVSHHLNTAMKHVMESSELKAVLARSVDLVKKIITLVKHAGLNQLLPTGSALKQEVETRFGSMCDTIERFVKSFEDLRIIIENNSSDATEKIKNNINDLISINKAFDNQYELPSDHDQLKSLTAAVEVFRPIRHAQTILEGNVCTIIQVLPLIERLKHNLKVMANSFPNSSSNEYRVQLSNIALREVDRIPYYDLWAAACIICPGLNSFSFMNPVDARSCREKGTNLVRKLVADARSLDNEGQRNPAASVGIGNLSERIVTPLLGTDSFTLSDSFSFLSCQRASSSDDLGDFLGEKLSKTDCDAFRKDDKYVVKFWIDRLETHPFLSKVALRLLSIPPSSASSERDFSVWKLINNYLRTSIDAELSEDIIVAKSAVTNDLK